MASGFLVLFCKLWSPGWVGREQSESVFSGCICFFPCCPPCLQECQRRRRHLPSSWYTYSASGLRTISACSRQTFAVKPRGTRHPDSFWEQGSLSVREGNSEAAIHTWTHRALPFQQGHVCPRNAWSFHPSSAALLSSPPSLLPSSVRCNLWAAPLPWPLSSLH